MKKMLVKFLRFLLKKLVKPVHYEYKMSKEELERINLMTYTQDICNNYESTNISGEIIETPELYVYNESIFSINMKNVPSKLIQGYNFINDGSTIGKVELEILLGGEGGLDVYDEIYKKYLNTIHQGPMLPEDMEINIYSCAGHNRKITLKDIRVTKFTAFNYCNSNSKELCKARVMVEYETKEISVF